MRIADHREHVRASLALLPADAPKGARPTDIRLARADVDHAGDRVKLWKPIIAQCLEKGQLPTKQILHVLEKSHLYPKPEVVPLIKTFVDEHLRFFVGAGATKDGQIVGAKPSNARFKKTAKQVRNSVKATNQFQFFNPRRNAYAKQGGQGKLTHEVLFDMIFRAMFRIVDADGSGALDASEIVACGSLVGLEMDSDEAARVVEDHDRDAGGKLEENEFVAYMCAHFVSVPAGVKGPLLDADTNRPFVLPHAGVLSVTVETDGCAYNSSAELGSDRGVSGLLKMIEEASTESEKMKLINCLTADALGGGGSFTSVQGQQIIDVCRRTARLEKYEMCKRLAMAMAHPLDCVKLLERNLDFREQVVLRCEMGSVIWRVCTGSLMGHYAFDCAVDGDVKMLKLLLARSYGEMQALRDRGGADVSQRGEWTGLLRNVRLDRQPYAGTLPLDADALPESGVLSFDVISANRPKKHDRALPARRFDALKVAVQAADWRDGTKTSPAALKKKNKLEAKKRKMTKRTTRRASSARDASPSRDASPPPGAGRRATSATNLGAPEDPEKPEKVFELKWPKRHGHSMMTAEQARQFAAELVESSFLGCMSSDLDCDSGNFRSLVIPEKPKPGEEAAPSPAKKKEPEAPASPLKKDPKRPRVRYVRLNMDIQNAGAATAFDSESAYEHHLPPSTPLAWMSLRLIELEVAMANACVTSEQAAALWDAMPDGVEWGELRVQLLCVLYRKIVDLENLGPCLLGRISKLDAMRVAHRLGPFAYFSPRHPDGFHRYILSRYEERFVFCVLLRIANRSGISQISEHMYRRSEDEAEYNWIPGWDVPSGWIEPNPKNLDDLCCPKEGTVQFRFATRDDAALHDRDRHMELFAAGTEAHAASLLRITAGGHILKR